MKQSEDYCEEVFGLYPIDNKEKAARDYVKRMLCRTQSMFEYEGLPETIPARELEKMLQVYGRAFVKNVDGELYAFNGGQGGEPNPYYLPTQFIIANPALPKADSINVIDVDGVLIWGDSWQQGLMPICAKYATLLTEVDITTKMAITNLRAAYSITAPDDVSKRSAEEYIRRIAEGQTAVIAENAFLDGVKIQPMLTGVPVNYLSQLVEIQQYLKASWFNELGLNANYNMKREAINSNESQLNYDSLLPLIDDMLKNRKIGIEKVNDMFGTKISVDLSSSWKELSNSKRLENAGEGGAEIDNK